MNVGMVHAAAKKHPSKFKVETRSASDHKAELTSYGIASHGVVVRTGDRTLWQHNDHQLSQSELDAGVQKVLSVLKE